MRGQFLVLVLGCGGAPSVPAHLEQVGTIPQISNDTPVAFDTDDHLLIMDGSGVRKLDGNRLDVVTNTASFAFGRFGVDRDGTVLLGSLNTLQLARLQAGVPAFISPTPPTSFDRIAGVPSGAIHLAVLGQQTTLVLAAGASQWVDSGKRLDRVLHGPDGSTFAVVDGDIVQLAADDSPQAIASCAEFAGGTCPGLELVGVDGAGGIVMAASGDQDLHILDPGSASFRDVALPGKLTIETAPAGSQLTLVLANDPDRAQERSLWMLAEGDNTLQRFATITNSFEFGGLQQPIVDHAGNGFLAGDGHLQAVVLE